MADVHEFSYSLVAHACAEIAWLAADAALAAQLEGPIRTKWLPCDFRNFGCDVRLSLARLCAIDGRVDEAGRWFDAARTEFEAQRARPLLAIADHDEARMHLRHPGHADRAAVGAVLNRALAAFTEIGMTGWIRRADDLRSELAASA